MIQHICALAHKWGIGRCEHQAHKTAYRIAGTKHQKWLNVGGGKRKRWEGVEVLDAGIDPNMDFNTTCLPKEDDSVDIIICEQVIEHLHNTTFFLSELKRILRPGGTLLLSTENLNSGPNKLAILIGIAPFSVQGICGSYVGGWKKGVVNPDCTLLTNHPAYSGCRGHVRVLTTRQLKELVRSSGLKVVQTYGYCFNHYVLLQITK